ncbi:hypothetical protein [Novosphingobium sp.]|jgi:hypothetical protein
MSGPIPFALSLSKGHAGTPCAFALRQAQDKQAASGNQAGALRKSSA